MLTKFWPCHYGSWKLEAWSTWKGHQGHWKENWTLVKPPGTSVFFGHSKVWEELLMTFLVQLWAKQQNEPYTIHLFESWIQGYSNQVTKMIEWIYWSHEGNALWFWSTVSHMLSMRYQNPVPQCWKNLEKPLLDTAGLDKRVYGSWELRRPGKATKVIWKKAEPLFAGNGAEPKRPTKCVDWS